MPVRPELLMRDMEGRPLPPSDLVAKLKAYDARIGLFYTKSAWAIIETWRETDARRAWIQDGSMPEHMAFDICGYLPLQCSLDEALPYIERELRGHTAESFAAIRAAANHWNETVQPAVLEDQFRGAVDADRTESVAVHAVTDTPVLSRWEQKQRDKKAARDAKIKDVG